MGHEKVDSLAPPATNIVLNGELEKFRIDKKIRFWLLDLGSEIFSPVRDILELKNFTYIVKWHSQERCKTNRKTGGRRGINPTFLSHASTIAKCSHLSPRTPIFFANTTFNILTV